MRCPAERKYIVRLSTLGVFLKSASELQNRVPAYTVLNGRYKVFRFLSNWNRQGSDCDFKREMWTALRPTYVGWHNAKMLAAHHSGQFPSDGTAISAVAI